MRLNNEHIPDTLVSTPFFDPPPLCVFFKVSRFLEALLSRCAADIQAGRGEGESPPLRLLADASFYEMEPVARSGECLLAVPMCLSSPILGSGGLFSRLQALHTDLLYLYGCLVVPLTLPSFLLDV